MSAEDSLNKILVVNQSPTNALHWQRRGMQVLTLAILVLIPLTGLLRIDVVAGAFVILDWQIWWSDFFIMFGFWLVLASGLVMLYSTVGTAFCGWSCPQNTLSELANQLTRLLLGKRAEMMLTGESMVVASAKNRWLNWLVLGGILLMVSMLMALIPLLYFYPPAVIWSFISFQPDERLAASLHYIYSICVLIILLDIAFIRHFWCRFMCVYKVWQHGFKTRQTLHVAYDANRSEECNKCNYCVSACFIDLDPRKTEIYDSCINCGECITACNNLQAKKGQAGLLSFKIGEQRSSAGGRLVSNLVSLSLRAKWTMMFFTLGVVMFAWGALNYQQFHLAAYRADMSHGSEIQDYRITVSNKFYGPAALTVGIDGLPEDSYQLELSTVEFQTAGRKDIKLHINSDLAKGLHPVIVRARSTQGWNDSFRLQHFVSSESR